MKGIGICAFIACGVFCALVAPSGVLAQYVFQDGVAVNGAAVQDVGLVPLAVGDDYTGAVYRTFSVSLGQLAGIDPATGEGLTNTASFFPVAPRWVTVDQVDWQRYALPAGAFASSATIDATMTTNGMEFALKSQYATGTPIYVEADPVWTSESTNYYPKGVSDARFASKSEFSASTQTLWVAVDAVDDNVATNEFSTNFTPRTTFSSSTQAIFAVLDNKLASNAWQNAASTTNYAPRTDFASATQSLWAAQTATDANLVTNDFVTNYLGRMGGEMSGFVTNSIGFVGNGAGITNLTLSGYNLATGTPIYVENDPIWTVQSAAVYTAIATKLDSATYDAAESTTNFAPKTDFSASTQAIFTVLDTKLDSNAWQSAESTTNFAQRTAFNASTQQIWAVSNTKLASNVWATAASTTNSLSRTDGVLSGDLNANGFYMTDVPEPVLSGHAANKKYVDDNLSGLNWRPSVLSYTSDPPFAPGVDDRYMVRPTGTGVWIGHDNTITHWNGSDWVYTSPSNTWAVYAEDTGAGWVFNDTQGEWVQFSGADLYTWGNGLANDGNTIYVTNAAGLIFIGDAMAVDTAWSDNRYIPRTEQNAESNALWNTVQQRLMSNVWASSDSTTNYLPRAGGVLGSDLNADSRRITSLGDPMLADDAVHKRYVDNRIAGLDWKNSVLSYTNNPPAFPSEDDRYLILRTGTGAWVGHDDEVALWEGSAWTFSSPSNNWAVFVDDSGMAWVYSSDETQWVQFSSTMGYLWGNGLVQVGNEIFVTNGTGIEFVGDALSVDTAWSDNRYMPRSELDTGSNALWTAMDAKLASNSWAAADSTTNYASCLEYNAATSAVWSAMDTKLASNDWSVAPSTTNYAPRTTYTAATQSLWIAVDAMDTNLSTNDFATNYASRADYNVATQELWNTSRTKLDSNSWEQADSTTNVLPRTGGIMSGALTNDVAFYGNGIGITNLSPGSFTETDPVWSREKPDYVGPDWVDVQPDTQGWKPFNARTNHPSVSNDLYVVNCNSTYVYSPINVVPVTGVSTVEVGLQSLNFAGGGFETRICFGEDELRSNIGPGSPFTGNWAGVTFSATASITNYTVYSGTVTGNVDKVAIGSSGGGPVSRAYIDYISLIDNTGTPLYSNDCSAYIKYQDGSLGYTGHFTVQNPTQTNHPATKEYVDTGLSQCATGTPVYVEADPVWVAQSAAVYTVVGTKLNSNNWAAADSTTNYLPRSGGVMSGTVTNNVGMYGNGIGITNLPAGAFVEVDPVWTSMQNLYVMNATLSAGDTNEVSRDGNVLNMTWNTNEMAGGQGAIVATNVTMMGPWSQGSSYPRYAVVSYGGQSFYSLNSMGASVVNPNTDTANWAIFAEKGTNGVAGLNGINGVGLLYMGSWTNTETYSTNMLVYHYGVSPTHGLFKCVQEHSNIEPGVTNTWETYWDVYLRDGSDGASGSVVSNLCYSGNFVPWQVYPSNAVVTYAGQTWIKKTDGGGELQPGTANWNLGAAKGTSGVNGLDGSDGVNGIGNMYWYTLWENLTSYPEDCLVSYSGTVYYSKSPNQGKRPDLNGTYWGVAVSRGADGANGADGLNYQFQRKWDENVTYQSDALVVFSNNLYYSIQGDNVGNCPTNAPAWWGVLVRSGSDGIGYNFLGDYRGASSYTTNNAVQYDGSLWGAAYNGASLGSPSLLNTNWLLVVSKGDQGPQGPQGAKGDDGTVTYVTNVLNVLTQEVQVVTNVYSVSNTTVYTTNAYFVTNQEYQTYVTNIYYVTNVVSAAITSATFGADTFYDSFNMQVGTNLDMAVDGNSVSINFDRTGMATGTPLYVELDPYWSSASNRYARLTNSTFDALSVTSSAESGYQVVNYETMASYVTNGGGSLSSTNAVRKTGDSMTGPLGVNATNALNSYADTLIITNAGHSIAIGSGVRATGGQCIAIGRVAQAGLKSCAIGSQANALRYETIAIGYNAVCNGGGGAIAIGLGANGNSGNGPAIGKNSDCIGTAYAAIGQGAYAGNGSAAIGQSANANNSGIAFGDHTFARYEAHALGNYARAYNSSIAMGRQSFAGTTNYMAWNVASTYGSYTNCIALGRSAGAFGHGAMAIGSYSTVSTNDAIAMGVDVTNAIADSCRIRGNLYLDGASTIYTRSTFGSGSWTAIGGGAGDVMSDGSVPMTGPLIIDVASNHWLEIIGGGQETNNIVIGRDNTISSNAVCKENCIMIGNSITNIDYRSVLIGHGTAVVAGPHMWGGNTIVGWGARGYDTYCTAIGYRSLAEYNSVAVGVDAKATSQTAVSIGVTAKASASAVAVGYSANNQAANGVAIGYVAEALGSGTAVGRSTESGAHGVAIGREAESAQYGVTVGPYSESGYMGLSLGYGQYGNPLLHSNIVIGAYAFATNNAISLGSFVSNDVPDTARIRGDLYLDGAATIYTRPTFGSGSWSALGSGSGDLMADGSVPMTGALKMQVPSVGASGITIRTPETGYGQIELGWGATGSYHSIAIGRFAKSANQGVAIGLRATAQVGAGNDGTAVGDASFSGPGGVAIGDTADAIQDNVAIGYMARADYTVSSETAVGYQTDARGRGTSLGYDADSFGRGVALGSSAKAQAATLTNGNIAVGYHATATGFKSSSIGYETDNDINDSCRIRGTLYLDGATNVMVRETFGSGAWSTLGGGGSSSDTNAVAKTGDTVTGALNVSNILQCNYYSGANYLRIDGVSDCRVAIGGANDVDVGGTAVGYDADATGGNSQALGIHAHAGQYCSVLGFSSTAISYSEVIGSYAGAAYTSIAMGMGAAATNHSIALGFSSKAGNATNICLGLYTHTAEAEKAIAIGDSVTNDVNESMRIRGDLYLDGATGVYTRATFGSGAWTQVAGNVAPIVSLAGPMALDWGILDGGFSRGVVSGVDVLTGDLDTFHYADAQTRVMANGAFSKMYCGLWADTGGTVGVTFQWSYDNGNNYEIVTNMVTVTDVPALYEIDLSTLTISNGLHKVTFRPGVLGTSVVGTAVGTVYLDACDVRGRE